MSIEILPAIIPESFEDLTYKMSLVKGIVVLVQIDICDGVFVPSKSWPYNKNSENHFEKIIEEEEGFPFWEDMDFEVDLMIKNPEESVEKWIKAGAKKIVLHIESSPNILEFVREFRKKYGYFGDSFFNIEIGIAININTSNEILYKFLEKNFEGKALADFIQFMGIKKIGFQGQEFDKEVYGKISDLRKKNSDIIISVDGGVNFNNYKNLIKAGANKLISGSAIFESEDIKEAIEKMKKK